jgi:hypothetical protein
MLSGVGFSSRKLLQSGFWFHFLAPGIGNALSENRGLDLVKRVTVISFGGSARARFAHAGACWDHVWP